LQGVPRAVLHIGPAKTSSSRIQRILHNLKDELIGVNYHLPHYNSSDGTHSTSDPKGLAKFFLALKESPLVNAAAELQFMSKFLKTSLDHKHNIILSAEAFSILEQHQIAKLKEMLHGFEVLVVFVYRDILSQIVSYHFEFNRFEQASTQFSTSFSAFLLQSMSLAPKHRPRPLWTISNYSTVFGVENMRIIDLHGTNAAKKEVTHVILCQIAGVLCNRTNLTDVSKGVFSNPSYSLIPAQVFSHFKAYVVKLNDGKCRFCDSLSTAYTHFMARYNKELVSSPPPRNISNGLSLLLPYAKQVDALLRDTYKDSILEGNREANLKRMAQVRVEELDEDVFLEDVHWDQWIRSEYQNALLEGRLCNC